MRFVQLASLFLLSQGCFAEDVRTEDPLEGISYEYPFFYDDSEDSFAADVHDRKSSETSEKKESPDSYEEKIGNVEYSLKVENTDFVSQCHAEWEKTRKQDEPKRGKKLRGDEEDKEDNHSPKVSFSASAKWSIGD